MENTFQDIDDFLTAPAFTNWVLHNRDAAVWELWMQQHPEKLAVLQAARELALQLSIQESVPDSQLREAEQRLVKSISNSRRKTKKKWWWMAAAAVLLSAGGSALFLLNNRQVRLQTAFGETKSQVLPDGSEVMLNANTRVRFASQFSSTAKREVWLSGEAFFHVQQTPQRSRFIVHTNKFDIIVTGTRFNVVNTDTASNVALQKGSIVLKALGEDSVYLKAGDFVTYQNHRLVKQTVEADKIAAWTNQQLMLDKTTMKQLAVLIKMHYGIEVTLDTSLYNETLSGILPNNNLSILLQSLQEVMDVSVIQNGNNIVITKKNGH